MPLLWQYWPVSSEARLPEQVGAAQNALPEEDALVGEQLDVGRGHLVAVRLHVAAGVVRVDVEDVGRSRIGHFCTLLV